MTRFPAIILLAAALGFLTACQVPFEGLSRQQIRVSGIAGSLEEARLAWNIMADKPPGSYAAMRARERYNSAVSVVLASLGQGRGTGKWKEAVVVGGETPWRITFDAPERNLLSRTFSPREFSRYEIARDIKLTGFDNSVARDGVGVPVVLEQDETEKVAQPFHSPQGEFLPATAVLEFPSVAGEAKLRFYNVMEVSDVQMGGRTAPLAENLTAALERALTYGMAEEEDVRHPGEKVRQRDGTSLFFLQRYDPSKTPVVFVHGLMSGPKIWKNAVNGLLADRELRRRYQPVCFTYPSGLPIPVTAARLRESLRNARESLDPGRDDTSFGRTVLVGHSMGGLVSRMQVIDSGEDFWDAFFVAPRWRVSRGLDTDTRKMLRDSLYFKRGPDVARAVFICTPHRGSELADVGIYQTILRLMLFLPRTAKEGLKELADLPVSFVQPELRNFANLGVHGMENLSTRHPFFDSLEERPIQVPYDSIIATDAGFDVRNSTDRVVPYSSSHLDGAASETLVPYWHGCVERAGTVKAVLKVLKNH